MLLIDWFKNLKWIRAIRSHDFLMNLTSQQADKIARLENIISKYERGSSDITRKLPPDLQGIFEAHRQAARQSINDAYQAELDYKRKLND